MLNVKNINEEILKVDNLLKYEQYLNKMKELYVEKKNYGEKKNYDFDNNFKWLSDIIKKYKKNEAYKNYCKTIMEKNKIKNFDDFKDFINNILVKNKKNKGFIVEVKNILCEDDYYTKNKKIHLNKKKVNYETTQKMKTEINKITTNSENSNDIKFSQNEMNDDIFKNKHINTYY